MDRARKFHDKQKNHFNDDIKKDGRESFHESWFNEETVDFWRHKRMYETIRPIAEHFNDKAWVSIGDGRYGLDSVRLKKIFGINVFPTDISEFMLHKAQETGLIKSYSVENAENMSFEDNSFDIVFCKESFHHFARPIIALYEMIRISKIAVILIEPYDYVLLSQPKKLFRQIIKLIINTLLPNNRFINKRYDIWNMRNWHSFEDSGNYVYSVSIRELEKIVHGIDLGGLAYKGFNDFYIKGCEFEKAEQHSKIFREISQTIKERDFKANKFPVFFGHNLVTAVIFKQNVDDDLRTEMINNGFIFPDKHKNPYI